MRMPSPIVAGSIAIGVFAGGFAVGHFVTDNGSSTKAAGKPQVLGQVFANNPDATATTTTAAPAAGTTTTTQASSSPTTATTAQPSPATQVKTVTVTQTQTTATSTVVVPSADCGSGTATASVSAQTFPRQNNPNTDYETDAKTTVNNGVNKPIQIDNLTIRFTYEDGGTQDIVISNASGAVLQPGASATYSVAVNTGKRPVRSDGVSIQNYSFHTQGHPECAGRAA